MKKVFLFALTITLLLSGCGSSNNGELTGVLGRKKFFEPEPLEMAFVPAGSFTMGQSDQDAFFAMNTTSKTVTVEAFWMDQMEVSNNKYRQFVYYVRDSILRTKLAEAATDPKRHYYMVDKDDNVLEPKVLNWDEKIDWKNPDDTATFNSMYYPSNERFNGQLEVDTRRLLYSYSWVDLKQASRVPYKLDSKTDSVKYMGQVTNLDGVTSAVKNRGNFIMHDVIPVYPDTLCWIRDWTYSFNDPMASLYFWHPSYDDYPVVGVSWVQAKAFSIWRTNFMNTALRKQGVPDVEAYRLPTETEWEFAARGGLDLSMYPWGGPYTRNDCGCFLANFKPMRGNYIDDGSVYAAKCGSFLVAVNEYGLYDMAGNVAEWTSSAYAQNSYIFTHDLNPNYEYNAKPGDPPVMKRKVVRGGSWKDIAYFLQCGARDYEYQDSTKPYVGFRNVRSYIGVN